MSILCSLFLPPLGHITSHFTLVIRSHLATSHLATNYSQLTSPNAVWFGRERIRGQPISGRSRHLTQCDSVGSRLGADQMPALHQLRPPPLHQQPAGTSLLLVDPGRSSQMVGPFGRYWRNPVPNTHLLRTLKPSLLQLKGYLKTYWKIYSSIPWQTARHHRHPFPRISAVSANRR